MTMLQSPMPFGADLHDASADYSMDARSPPRSPLGHHHYHHHGGPHHRHHFGASKKPSIDHSKLKTKLCRHYLMGLPCPFESRCAFAHGEEQLLDRPAHSHAAAPPAPSPLSPGASRAPSSCAAVAPFVPRGDGFAATCGAPPSYNAFMAFSATQSGAGSEADVESPGVSRPPSPPPPAYPSRFRYEPYSAAAVIYQP